MVVTIEPLDNYPFKYYIKLFHQLLHHEFPLSISEHLNRITFQWMQTNILCITYSHYHSEMCSSLNLITYLMAKHLKR